MDEGPFSASPLFPKRTRSITGYATHDKHRTILKQISHTNIDTRINMFFTHEYPLHDVLHYVLACTRSRWTC